MIGSFDTVYSQTKMGWVGVLFVWKLFTKKISFQQLYLFFNFYALYLPFKVHAEKLLIFIKYWLRYTSSKSGDDLLIFFARSHYSKKLSVNKIMLNFYTYCLMIMYVPKYWLHSTSPVCNNLPYVHYRNVLDKRIFIYFCL